MLSATINALKKIKSTQAHTQGINHSRSIPHMDFDNNVQKNKYALFAYSNKRHFFTKRKRKDKRRENTDASLNVANRLIESRLWKKLNRVNNF